MAKDIPDEMSDKILEICNGHSNFEIMCAFGIAFSVFLAAENPVIQQSALQAFIVSVTAALDKVRVSQ